LHKVPTGSKGAGGTVGDKEEAVRGKGDGSMEGSTSNRGSWKRGIIRRETRDSSGGRDRSSGDRRG
jgi:hypothetical protein